MTRSGRKTKSVPCCRGRPPKGTRGETRQELLDAALRLFARRGYEATTVRQIADEVDVRASALYADFHAKQELLESLVEQSGPQLLDRLPFDFSAVPERHPADALPELTRLLVEEWDRTRTRQHTSLFTREGLSGGVEGLGNLRERLREPFQRWSADGLL